MMGSRGRLAFQRRITCLTAHSSSAVGRPSCSRVRPGLLPSSLLHALYLALLLGGIACGGHDVPEASITQPLQGNCSGTMSAQLDSGPWSAMSRMSLTRVDAGFSLVGIDPGGRAITISVGLVAGEVTLHLEPGNASGASVLYSIGSRVWAAAPSLGGAGVIHVTSFTSARALGTFSFVAVPTSAIVGNTATGSITATNGQYDVVCQ
jgi:hypothetical protein